MTHSVQNFHQMKLENHSQGGTPSKRNQHRGASKTVNVLCWDLIRGVFLGGGGYMLKTGVWDVFYQNKEEGQY